jgi:DNA-binding response OmpR family regulator
MGRVKVLIVDDDSKLRETLGRGLEEQGATCHGAASADEADGLLREASLGPFDVILLDVMMPGRSGWDLLRDLRARGDDTPVIFLTARHELEERVRGLELGADDYVLKPFEFRELTARVEAVLRRRSALPAMEVGELRVDLARHLIELAGSRVETSSREFDFLRTLAQKPGRTYTRKELLHEVWGIDFDPGTNVVDVLVARLRRKLERGGRPRLIETVIGEGYRLGNGSQ